MILVVTVSQLKTSVPCDRIMQENEDMECVWQLMKGKNKKQQQQKEHKKILVTGFHNHILIKKKTTEDLKINKIKKYITHYALI